MSLYVICNILSDSQIVHSVDSASSIVGLLNSVTPDVGVVHSADQVEVNGVSVELEGLSHVIEVHIFDSRC